MVVYDIPDLQRGGGDLGSVVFSESFLESSIYIQQGGEIFVFMPSIYMIQLEHLPKQFFKSITFEMQWSNMLHAWWCWYCQLLLFIASLDMMQPCQDCRYFCWSMQNLCNGYLLLQTQIAFITILNHHKWPPYIADFESELCFVSEEIMFYIIWQLYKGWEMYSSQAQTILIKTLIWSRKWIFESVL